MNQIDELKLRRMVCNYKLGLIKSHRADANSIATWVSRYALAMRTLMFEHERSKTR